MNTPKLFTFPGGATIDLQSVFAISPVYRPLKRGGFYIRVFFTHASDQQFEYFVGDCMEDARDEHKALIDRWAQDR